MSFFSLSLLLILAQPVPAEQAGSPSRSAEVNRVDRGLQAVVFPDRVRLQYDLGLSSTTTIALLNESSRDVPDTNDRRALMEAFRDMAVPEIQRRCRITIDGVPLELRILESRIFPKHYVQLTCIFESPLPAASGTVRLKMVDGSFRGCDGNHLIALKAEDGARLRSSTVPLILARVPRESLSNDSAAQREASRRAEAVIQLQSEPVEPPAETHRDPFANAPQAEEPIASPSVPEDARWTKILWVTGFSVGILAVLLVCWWRVR